MQNMVLYLYKRKEKKSMKNNNEEYRGIIRSVDKIGRIVIPIEYRKLLGLDDDYKDVEIICKGNSLIITNARKE